MSKFIPTVAILGNESEIPNDLPEFEIVGKISTQFFFDQSVQAYVCEIFFNGNRIEDMKSPPFDYILCTNRQICDANKLCFHLLGLPIGMLATTNFFREFVSNVGFICEDNTQSIIELMNRINGRILDLDSYFMRADLFDLRTQIDQNISIDTVAQDFEPIFRNVYDEIFSNFDEIKFRHYDLILLTADRSLEELIEILNWAIEFSDEILVYIHCDSPDFEISIDRAEISWIKAIRGKFLRIKSKIARTNRIYVSTHKNFFIPKLPKGYQLIHAGKKIFNDDLGFQGDDTGDNVSELNVQINELSAIYWVWKNAPHVDYIGFASYRRFFAIPGDGEISIGNDGEHVATVDELIDLLQDCDMIVGIPTMNVVSFEPDFQAQYDIGRQIFRKHFENQQPDYVETLNRVEAGNRLITNTIFFTRWSLFNEYCKFLYSFLIPAAREYATNDRTMSYKGEQAFSVFCEHNNLRLKFLPILKNKLREATAENFSFRDFERVKLIVF